MPTLRDHTADEAGVGPDPTQVRHLTPLRELRKWRVARGEPDIRGWHVFTSNGRDVGRVAELLVDDTIGEVVMFDIAVERTSESVLAPIRAAGVDRANKRVILDGAQVPTRDDVLPALGRSVVEKTPAAEAPRIAAADGGTAPALPPPPSAGGQTLPPEPPPPA